MPAPRFATRSIDLRSGLLLVLACVAVYAGKLSGPLLWADLPSIVENPTIRAFDLGQMFSPPRDTAVAGRPLANASFALDYALTGLGPLALHACNLALHVLVALLAWLLLRTTLEHGALPGGVRERARGLSLAAAALFALHPLAAGLVLGAFARAELLHAVFYLGALLLLARAAAGGSVSRAAYVGAALLALAAGVTHEVFATLPLCAWLFDRAFFAGSFRAALAARGKLYLCFALSIAPIALLQLQHPRPGSVRFGDLDYLIAQGKVLSDYVAVAFWPARPALDYGPLLPQDLAASLPYVLRTACCVAVLAVLAFSHPRLGFLGAFCLALLAPSSSVFAVHTEVGAERRAYLPLLAVVAYVVLLADAWFSRLSLKPSIDRALRIGLTLAVASTLALSTRSYASSFHSARSAWLAATRARPENPRAYYELAEALRGAGELDRARAALLAALERDASFVDAHLLLSELLRAHGDLPQALSHAERAVELAPKRAAAHLAYASVLLAAGRSTDAIAQLATTLELDPSHAEAHAALADALLSRGRVALARPHIDWLRAHRPRDPRIAGLSARLRSLLALPSVHVTPLPDALISRAQGTFLGADAAYSIDLGPRVLWLYGDTFVDPRADGSRENGPNYFVRNSIALQGGPDAVMGHDLQEGSLSYHYGPEHAGVPSAFLRDDDDDLPGGRGAGTWIWPLHGARLPSGELLLFRMHVALHSGGLGFAVVGWDAVAVDDPLAPPETWKLRQVMPLTAAAANSGMLLGASVLVHERHLYVYAARNDPREHAIYLARFALASLRGLPPGALAAPEWFCGASRGFLPASGCAEPPALFRDGQIELSVSYVPSLQRFVEIQTRAGLLADPATAIGARFASDPEGPWSALVAFHRPREATRPDAANLLSYAAKAHPEQRDAGLVVTYVVNDLKHPVPPDALYYPRALRVTFEPASVAP